MSPNGSTSKGCPLCGDMAEGETSIPKHIRRRCPVAAQIRVYEHGLPPDGYGAPPAGPGREHDDMPDRDKETGKFLQAGASA